jgi:DNA-binding response OmpR family regulator
MAIPVDPADKKDEHRDPVILLVEDDEGVRRLARIVLEGQAYRVLEAHDVPSALHLALSYPHKIDALVTDVVLPGGSGKVLAESLYATRPELKLKVLFLSGYTDEMINGYGVRYADVRFLQKPFTPDMLIRKVQDMLFLAVWGISMLLEL